MSKKVRTRFAPSPTGPLHMGGVRTALYCYLFAKKNNGDFILRIEDTDQTRYVESAEKYIIQALQWCNIEPNEGVGFGGDFGPYRQSERKEIYKQYVDMLLEKGHAYYVFTKDDNWAEVREKLEKEGQQPKYGVFTRDDLVNSLTLSKEEVEKRLNNGDAYAVRFKIPKDQEVLFADTVRGNVRFTSNELDDKVILKSDGMPTYHLANVVDDHLMQITHVIRGEEWLPSTPLHVLMYQAFGWDIPSFAHLPLILKPDGKGKLSKRDGDRLGFPVFPLNWKDPKSGEASLGYKERGFLPEAFTNMLAFLGWNPGTEQELFSLEELEEVFSLEKVGKSGAKFDFAKAQWFNQQYIINKTDDELVEMSKPYFKNKGYEAYDEKMKSICGMLKERVTFLHEFPEKGFFFFEEVVNYDEKTIRKKWKIENEEKFKTLQASLNSLQDFTAENIENSVKQFMEENELGFGQVLPFLRIAMTGSMQGPPIFDVMSLLGKETVNKRLETGIPYFSTVKKANA